MPLPLELNLSNACFRPVSSKDATRTTREAPELKPIIPSKGPCASMVCAMTSKPIVISGMIVLSSKKVRVPDVTARVQVHASISAELL